jgi:hypothetical protein
MALAALSSQLGTPLKDFEGVYDWKPSSSCCCSVTAELVAVDRDTFQWQGARCCGSIPCASCLKPVHERDARSPNQFYGTGGFHCYPIRTSCCDNDTVWVLDKTTAPLSLHVAPGPTRGQAPLILAMRRATSTPGGDADLRIVDEEKVDWKRPKAKGALRAPTAKTAKEAEKEHKKAQREEDKLAERAAIAEAMENARRKEERAKRVADRQEKKAKV